LPMGQKRVVHGRAAPPPLAIRSGLLLNKEESLVETGLCHFDPERSRRGEISTLTTFVRLSSFLRRTAFSQGLEAGGATLTLEILFNLQYQLVRISKNHFIFKS
jgi:hypothetical protein